MNKVILCTMIMGLGISLSAFAQKRTINRDWEFQRLTERVQNAEIKNQGTDWNSQYNVEHVNAAVSELRVPEDTLKAEFNLLRNGEWANVSLPHTPFVEDLTVLHQWQGICYYKKQLVITPDEAQRQLWIEFEGAMHLADIWINGKHIMQHAGGYTPFVVDATGKLKAGVKNEILVRLDNRNNPLIPPGKPLENLDFCYYGGIYRDVNLISKADVHITHPILADTRAGGGVFVTYPKVAENQSCIHIKTEVANQSAMSKQLTLRHTLFEWTRKSGKGKKVSVESQPLSLDNGKKQSCTQNMVVERPKLWTPEHPHLYILLSEVLDEGKVVDYEETRIGIRHIEMTREKGFVINGQPLRLVGSNRHMDYPYVGNAISDNAQYRDMYQIRSNGFNIVRLGHYPQDPSVLDACDELGLLAIEPIPGWQFFNKSPLFAEFTYRDIRDMIRRDRNHPSVVMWETTLNESWPPAEWKDNAVRVAHEEYPGEQCFTSGDAYGYDGFDVSYNDWQEGFHRPNKTKNPGFIREYYDYEFGGHYSTTRIRRGDGEKAQIQNLWNAQWSHNRYRAYYPWTMGDAVWSMYDYNRGCCDNICYSGVADLFRLPKFSLGFFRTQVPAGTPIPEGKMPFEVFIPTYRAGVLSDTVSVYGNVDEVALWVNGKLVEKRKADNGADTDYISYPDGGNCMQLAYPPFTFTKVPKEKGELKAVGYSKGKKVSESIVTTPGEPVRLHISYFESGRSASKDDLLIVHVSLLDKRGVLCPLNAIPVRLSLEGGEIVGPSAYQTESGIASFLVRTADASKLKFEATSGTMQKVRTLNLMNDGR